MLKERSEIHGNDKEFEWQFAGIEAGFESLVEETRVPLTSFLYRFVHDQRVVENLVQDAFVEAYRSWHSRRTRSDLTTSVYRIAIAVAHRHTDGTHSHHATEAATLAPSPPAAEPLSQPAAKIRQCIDDLPEQQRIAVLLHKYQGLNCAQIAEVMEVGEREASSLLFCGYVTLHRQLTT